MDYFLKGYNMTSHIGDKIRFLRKEKGLSLNDVSQYIGLKTPNAILMIEYGQTSPTLERIEKICNLFDISIQDLLSIVVPTEHIERTEPTALGQKIKKARIHLGHSVAELAKASEIAENKIKRIEKGSSRELPSSSIFSIAKALNISVDYLLDDSKPIIENNE